MAEVDDKPSEPHNQLTQKQQPASQPGQNDASQAVKAPPPKPLQQENKPDDIAAPGGKPQLVAPQGPATKTVIAPKTVRRPAKPSRLQKRHVLVLLSFLLMVVTPLIAGGAYLYIRAADQYASHLGFSVRTEEQSSAIELLGGITELSGGGSADTDILFSYLTSQKLVRQMDQEVDLRGIWSKVSFADDPVFAYNAPGTIEDLMSHWKRKVSIVYDSGTGMIDLRVLTFEAQDSRKITETLLRLCSEMINGLSTAAREDAISYARTELNAAEERLKNARRDITAFRNFNRIVDPTIDTQGQMGLLNTLQQQLAETLIELDILNASTRKNDPRVKQATNRKEVIEDRIEAERAKLGFGTQNQGNDVFASLVGEYEGLVVEREFAEKSYTAALAGFDSAQAAASRQNRYLAPHIEPTLAEKAEYPERLKFLVLLGAFLFFFWAIVILIFYSLRDRS